MKKLILAAALAAPVSLSAITPMWLRDVKISPDGTAIAFTYKGDIWTVPSAGGRATRLTATPDYEASPVWSPDSRLIAFASDRNGNFDIFTVPVAGGVPTRLTYNSAAEIPEAFTPDGSAVMYSASIQDPAQSALFPTGRMTELYTVAVNGGAPKQYLATPARFISWATDGKSFLYQDVKGFEDEWRKHHTSSVTRDVWRYDVATGRHTNLTHRGGEDLNAVSAGDKIYFLSERDGKTINVYRANADATEAVAITDFMTHPVRFLSRSADGLLAFTYDGEIYTMRDGGNPAKVNIELVDDYAETPRKLTVSKGARESVASPDGKSVAFIYRGEVFVTSVEYKTTKQITHTAAAESDLSWSDDGKALIYTSERDGLYNIYKATMARDDEPNFANATIIDEKPMFAADGHERTAARMSPDGKKLAFILDRNILAVMDLATKQVTELTDGSTYLHRDGRFNYAWSPDGSMLALEVIDRKHDPYSDIAIIDVATGKMTNLTNSGYFDAQPRWALDGNAIIFASERYGMRNHASWGSMNDVMLVFLNQEAYDRFRLSEEDYELLKAAEEKAEKAEKDKDSDKKSDKKNGKKSKENDKKASEPTPKAKFDGIIDRIVRLTPMSSDLLDAIIDADGENLYYLISTDDNTQLWKKSLRGDDHSMVSTLDNPTAYFDASADGKTIFVFGSSMRKLDKGDKLKSISYSATMLLDAAAEREFMFDNISREERERFYVADMHGVDWPAMTDAYRKFLPYINNNYDFAELVSEWLGELNVSHTGGRFYGNGGGERTASLGLLYDMAYDGTGLRVAEIVENGPFYRATTKVTPGVIIDKINGIEITPEVDASELLTDIAGQKTLVSGHNPATGESFDEVIKPISSAAMNELLYKRWVKGRAAAVDSLSQGRLGYVHIRSMDDESFRLVYSDLLGKYNDREGVVIDVRWNGGGRLHEDVEVLFSGHKYFTQEIRGKESCDMPSRRWNKPSIMLIAEPCYSNAHGTPWVYKNRGIGKLVGMPVPGTMTSVNWVRMQDPTLVYGIPVIGYRLPDGSFLENQQLEPDIKVANDPAEVSAGRDAQLEAAVNELLKEIDKK